jgi:hypothetical protein
MRVEYTFRCIQRAKVSVLSKCTALKALITNGAAKYANAMPVVLDLYIAH